ncbi:MAG: GNAT family N-acetyltransferase [Candidatus Latescibacteria bacterium]|nr:GNAT family N-acetyltransferase [Candidatus Latescibacterota bacterium]
MPERQLRMRRPHFDRLPGYTLPEGYTLRTYRPGDEAAWAAIMNTGIGSGWTAELCAQKLTSLPQFRPDGLFFVTYDGQPVGSACAWPDAPDRLDICQLHMVCVVPEHRGKGLGRSVTLAVLHYMRDQGFQETYLLTDDDRLPALKEYLDLEYEPVYLDDSHRARWARVISQLGQTERWWRHARPEPVSYQLRQAEGNLALLVITDSSRRQAYDLARRTVFSALFHLGIPYRVLDLATARETSHALRSHSAILLAQSGIGDSLSDVFARQMAEVVRAGVGLISVDHRLDRYPDPLRRLLPVAVSDGVMTTEAAAVPPDDHFIVRTHDPAVVHRFVRPVEVACVDVVDDGLTLVETGEHAPALVVGTHGAGRVAQYLVSPAVWTHESFGHCEGLDDVFWKSIVWTARKPFVMKAMPPFVAIRVDEASGAADGFAWVRPLVARGWRPHVGVLTEEIHQAEWRTMADLARTGGVEWCPQSLTGRRGLYFHHVARRPYSDDEVQACLSQAKGKFDQYGIPLPRSLNSRDGEFGRNVIPLLAEWGVQYTLSLFLPNEPFDGDHVDWEPGPYGQAGFILDDLFGFPGLFAAVALHLPSREREYIDPARTRYTVGPGFVDAVDCFHERTVAHGFPANLIEDTARAAARAVRLGLDSRFYGLIVTREPMINALSPDEWERFLDRVDELTAGYGTIRASLDVIAEYGRSHAKTHLARAEYDRETGRFHLTLSGRATVPLFIQVFDEACQERVERVMSEE